MKNEKGKSRWLGRSLRLDYAGFLTNRPIPHGRSVLGLNPSGREEKRQKTEPDGQIILQVSIRDHVAKTI